MTVGKREISNVQQQAERLELPALSADDQALVWTIQHGTNLNADMIWRYLLFVKRRQEELDTFIELHQPRLGDVWGYTAESE